MSESGEKLSLIDLIEYFESGPVLKQRTPDLNRTSFHSGDGEHSELDNPPSPGKSVTSSIGRKLISKKALGLTDIPMHATPGNTGAFRQRDEYNEEDFEAQFTTGFGGHSELDNFLEKEDKPPTNISRKLNTDKKIKILGDLDKMSFQKSELLKLAKALRYRGQDSFAYRVESIALRKAAQSSLAPDKQTMFLEVWNTYSVADSLKEVKDPEVAFIKSLYSELGTTTGTQEGLMLAALYAASPGGLNQKEINQALSKTWRPQSDSTVSDALSTMLGVGGTILGGAVGGIAGGLLGAPAGASVGGAAGGATGGAAGMSLGAWLGNKITGGKDYSQATIREMIESELSGYALEAALLILSGRVTKNNFRKDSRGKWGFVTPSETVSGAQPGGFRSSRDTSTTQRRTWADVQNKLNELYADGGTLEGKVENRKIKGTDVKIPLDVDGILGPQTKGAYKDATGSDLGDAGPDAAYNELEKISPEEATDAREGEEVAEEGTVDKGAILRGARLNSVGSLDEWYTAPADDGKTLVAIRKSDGQLAAMSIQTFDVVKNKEGGHTLTQSEKGQPVWTDMENRGESDQILFQSGSDYLSGREQRGLMKVIRDAGPDKEKEKMYRDVIVGQRRSERGGLLNQRGAKRRGERREAGARESLRGRKEP